MKAVNRGNQFDIFDDSMLVYNQLPAQPYIVRFQDRRGFFLEKYNDMVIKEDKVYGVHEEKLNKVMNAYNLSERNLGVILSGDKGIGKSMFSKMLANRVIESGMPLIVVDTYIPGIASYLESIEQEVMVLFDEFDKTFGEVTSRDGEASPQTNLLSLFDGLSAGKKMFVITCNSISKLNDYLINRPGRFHYHFRFEYPTSEEITEYMMDKVNEKFHGEIDSVVEFSEKVDLNYDCLRAIAFELNTGVSFKEAIKDLNILNIGMSAINVVAVLENGEVLSGKDTVDMFNPEMTITPNMYNDMGKYRLEISVRVSSVKFDRQTRKYIVDPEAVEITHGTEVNGVDYEKMKISSIFIEKRKDVGLHYAL